MHESEGYGSLKLICRGVYNTLPKGKNRSIATIIEGDSGGMCTKVGDQCTTTPMRGILQLGDGFVGVRGLIRIGKEIWRRQRSTTRKTRDGVWARRGDNS